MFNRSIGPYSWYVAQKFRTEREGLSISVSLNAYLRCDVEVEDATFALDDVKEATKELWRLFPEIESRLLEVFGEATFSFNSQVILGNTIGLQVNSYKDEEKIMLRILKYIPKLKVRLGTYNTYSFHLRRTSILRRPTYELEEGVPDYLFD